MAKLLEGVSKELQNTKATLEEKKNDLKEFQEGQIWKILEILKRILIEIKKKKYRRFTRKTYHVVLFVEIQEDF